MEVMFKSFVTESWYDKGLAKSTLLFIFSLRKIVSRLC